MSAAARILIGLVCFALSGCVNEPPPADAPPAPPRRVAVTLRVNVLEDADLRRALERLRGEWRERSGGELEIAAAESAGGAEALCRDADLVVFPSRLLGELCEDQLLRAARARVLRDQQLRFDDFLPLVREVEIVYGGVVMALPLGCPAPALVRIGADGPLTVPDDDRRLGLAYLAWAAPHVVHRSRVAALFSAESLEPRLTEPPFVRALDRMAEASAQEGAGSAWIAWPSRAATVDAAEAAVAVSEPPGADEAFNPIAGVWEPLNRQSPRATLLASEGRLIGVTTATRNAADAFRLAAWLAGPENSAQLATASDGVANCRGSLARRPDAWLAGAPGPAKDFAAVGAAALRASRYLIAPRLPGAEAYLRALGAAVRRRLAGESDSPAALAAASEAWQAITDGRGRAGQRRAYLRSVGAADYAPPR